MGGGGWEKKRNRFVTWKIWDLFYWNFLMNFLYRRQYGNIRLWDSACKGEIGILGRWVQHFNTSPGTILKSSTEFPANLLIWNSRPAISRVWRGDCAVVAPQQNMRLSRLLYLPCSSVSIDRAVLSGWRAAGWAGMVALVVVSDASHRPTVPNLTNHQIWG